MANFNAFIDILISLGIPGLMTLTLGWVGKRYLDSKLEQEKSEHQQEIKFLEGKLNHYLEINKQKIKNSEHFFQKQFDASQDLYGIKVKMLPSYSHPDMDWYEALQEMSSNLDETASSLQSFLNEYFTVLSPDIVEKLERAINTAESGQFYDDEHGLKSAETVYDQIKECSSLIKADVDGQRLVEFKDIRQNNSDS